MRLRASPPSPLDPPSLGPEAGRPAARLGQGPCELPARAEPLARDRVPPADRWAQSFGALFKGSVFTRT